MVEYISSRPVSGPVRFDCTPTRSVFNDEKKLSSTALSTLPEWLIEQTNRDRPSASGAARWYTGRRGRNAADLPRRQIGITRASVTSRAASTVTYSGVTYSGLPPQGLTA